MVRWRGAIHAAAHVGLEDVHVAAPLAQDHVAVVQQVLRARRCARVVGLAHVVDVGAARSMVRRASPLRLGQAGALEHVDQRQAAVEQLGAGHARRRRVRGHGQQHVLAQAGDLLAEQRGRRLLALGHLGLAVDQSRPRRGPAPSGRRAAPGARRLRVEMRDLVVVEEGEEPQQLPHLLVGRVDEELVHGERAGAPRDRARRCPSRSCRTWCRRASTMSGVVKPQTSSPHTLRMRSIPMVMLPHWSLPPNCRLQPWSTCRRRKS